MFSSSRTRNCGLGKLRASSTAPARRYRRAVRAGARVSEERTDLVSRFSREDMFELAGLLLDFRFAVHRKTVGKQALSQAVTADDAAGAFASARSQLND